MGNTTDKIKEGIKDTAGAVKRGAEKAKDAAVRGVDKEDAPRGVPKVKDKTDRAAEKVKEALSRPSPSQDGRRGRVRHVQTPGRALPTRGGAGLRWGEVTQAGCLSSAAMREVAGSHMHKKNLRTEMREECGMAEQRTSIRQSIR